MACEIGARGSRAKHRLALPAPTRAVVDKARPEVDAPGVQPTDATICRPAARCHPYAKPGGDGAVLMTPKGGRANDALTLPAAA
jgi:hypothetical protein